MKYDTFELTARGEIRINGRDLIEIIREVELPFAQQEYEERTSAEAHPEELSLLAGEYAYPPPSHFFLPCRNLLDQPACVAEKGFVLEENDHRKGKALLLECPCGNTECWFLEVHIHLTTQTVHWSNFSQFHRDWKYDLEFTFDRQLYEQQLEPKTPSLQ